MKTVRSYFVVLAVVMPWTIALAQTVTADEYFNRAARQYVKEDKGAALRTLDKGLQAYPGDARMLKLADELLKEQKQQQQQMAQQQQEQQQEQQRQQRQQRAGEEEQRKKEEQQGQQAKEGEDRKRQNDPMNKKDAERILDALQRKEEDTQRRVRSRQRPTQRTIEKDW